MDDVQGIFIGNKFHAKEACVSISDFEIRTFLISTLKKHSEPTNKSVMVNTWLFNHFHGIHWSKDNTTRCYTRFNNNLNKKETTILCRIC